MQVLLRYNENVFKILVIRSYNISNVLISIDYVVNRSYVLDLRDDIVVRRNLYSPTRCWASKGAPKCYRERMSTLNSRAASSLSRETQPT